MIAKETEAANAPIHVLVVSSYFDTHRGGVEIVAGRLANELAQRGLQVTWLATDATHAPADGQTRTLAIKALNFAEERLGFPYPLPGPAGLRRIAKAVRAADAVILHDSLYATSIAAFAAAKVQSKPVLIIQHIGQVPYSNPVLRIMMTVGNLVITQPLLSAADQVVFISGFVRDFFAKVRYRRAPQVIYNGVDTSAFKPAVGRDEVRALRDHFALDDDRPVALFVGRFVEKKGLNYLRDAAALRPDIQWVFAGWGPIDPAKWDLPNVRVLAGLRGSELGDLYRASDVLVLPSKGEGFPLVVQEALACGLPVVCGAELREADPEAADLLFTVDLIDRSVSAVAEAVVEQVSRAVHLGRTGPEARRRSDFARSRYAWNSITDRYLGLLESIGVGSARPGDRAAVGERAHEGIA